MLLPRLLPRCTFPEPGTRVDCAVSGGPDSLALLVLATHAGCRVTAIHVDHCLRPGSDGEAAVVAAAADHFGAAFTSLTAPVAAGPNLEARARDLRYAALPPGVFTGHTADDQAETVLLNLLRGAGLDGLAGMSPDRRPLIRLRRTETRALCAEVGLEPLADPMNADPRFRRNRVRQELLPLADAIAQRDVALLVARQAELLRDDAAALEEFAGVIDPTDAAALAAAPIALARRAVRRWLATDHPPDAAAVERVLAVANKDATSCDIGGGRRVRRSAGRLVLETPSP